MTTETAFDTLLRDLRKLVEDQVMPCYKWYSTHKAWPRLLFRLGGMIVVIGSLSLPAIATSDMPLRDPLLTAVSLAVAAFSSLNAFFRWDGAWRSRTRAAYDLQGMLARWEFRLKSAEFSDDPRKLHLRRRRYSSTKRSRWLAQKRMSSFRMSGGQKRQNRAVPNPKK